MSKTKVIFRKWNGDIIALFPEIASYNNSYYCLSYMSIGQHSTCDPYHIVKISKRATENEYNYLKQELESIGYDLKVCKQMPYQM